MKTMQCRPLERLTYIVYPKWDTFNIGNPGKIPGKTRALFKPECKQTAYVFHIYNTTTLTTIILYGY